MRGSFVTTFYRGDDRLQIKEEARVWSLVGAYFLRNVISGE
jgi:hypothetical protein